MAPDATSDTEVELLVRSGLANSATATARAEDWLVALRGLNNRDKVVIVLRFLFGLSQYEVADWLGVTRTRVFQMEQRALGRLRNRNTEIFL